MKPEIIKLSILTFLSGFFCKLYDDMNDNDLFEKHIFLKNNKEYINEFLKGISYILMIFVSSTYIYPLLLFNILNITQFIFGTSGFELPYEYTGMILCICWNIYLILFENKLLYNLTTVKFIMMVFFYIINQYIFDIYLLRNIEFGYKKLIFRFICVIYFSLSILINNYYNFFPDEELFCIWWIVGYLFTSCIFQIYLIINSRDKSKIININELERPVFTKSEGALCKPSEKLENFGDDCRKSSKNECNSENTNETKNECNTENTNETKNECNTENTNEIKK